MSENHAVSPLLDGFILGQVISDHQGVRCIPAMREGTDQRYIVKIVSIPASQTQLDALLLTGAYQDAEQAQKYFYEQAQALVAENDQLSKLEGFSGYEGIQIVPMESGVGYEIYMLSPYRPALSRQMLQAPLTQLAAVNLGLDICQALTVCRQAGYIYTDLKPGNVYSTETRGYCIGDLGLIPLTSLKYASLPEKYRSSYTAPEISDAFAALNDTLDVYALGLVLYQVYNNGQLPFTGTAPQENLLPPAYADYEMAQIILKACDPDPSQRWENPAQMSQELVNYMQRNGVEAVPIIPPPVEIIDETEPDAEFLTEEENDAELAQLLALIPEEESPEDMDEPEDSFEENAPEVEQMLALADELIEHELPEPAVAPEPIDIPIPAPLYDQVEESEAEEEPAPLPVPVEEPIIPEPAPPVPEEYAEDDYEDEDFIETPPRHRISGRLIGFFVAVALLVGLCIGIYFYYQNHYLQTIDTLSIQGNNDQVTVFIHTDADESLLSVSCSDSYGNTMRSGVVDGKATFSGLRPNYQYRIQIHISGRHKLLGSTSGTYTASYPEDYFQTIDSLSAISTDTQIIVTIQTDADQKLLSMICTDPEGKTQKSPIIGGKAAFTGLTPNTRYTMTLQIQGKHELKGQTSVICETKAQIRVQDLQFTTGTQDGSLVVQVIADGDPGLWTLYYNIEGQEPDSVTLATERFELFDLQIGQEYTFRLEAPGAYLAGQTQWTYTPKALLLPQDIRITSCIGGVVSLEWIASDGSADSSWTVHCFNNAGIEQTISVTGNSAQITGLDSSMGYTFTVTAQGMTKGRTVSITANPITITGFVVENVTDTTMDLVWSFDGNAPADGWVLAYTVNGGEQIRLDCTESRATLPLTAGAEYTFHVSPAAEITCINGDFQYTAPAEQVPTEPETTI